MTHYKLMQWAFSISSGRSWCRLLLRCSTASSKHSHHDCLLHYDMLRVHPLGVFTPECKTPFIQFIQVDTWEVMRDQNVSLPKSVDVAITDF